MRGIFVTLLAVNVLLLVWGFIAREPAVVELAPIKAFKYGGVAKLELLSEASGVNPPVSLQRSTAIDQPPTVDSLQDNKPLCEMVGVFKDQEQAGLLLERLEAIDIVAEIKEVELPAGSRYQIYLPPAPSRKAALRKLTELQAKKVDSYIIPKGNLENGISLGMFSQEVLAKDHLKKMQGIGLEPKMNVIERTYWEIWVMLAPGEGKKMSSLAWSRVLEGLNDIERRQNFCLDVAS
ncbi:hypothetical protein P886_2559 [Alteromonadaceae bacterium 2753L.S.0a.02]|nr:hypothetical protein P886_2559 [Alteromonadaceae bacterium 2753L.S.0a.02]